MIKRIVIDAPIPATPEEILFDQIKKLYGEMEQRQQILLEQYKVTHQKYPIGFTFPYKGDTAKINKCFVHLIEPDYVSHYDYAVYLSYNCYVPSMCDREILKPFGGTMIMGDSENNGVRILQVEIDRILEESKVKNYG